jgi:ABC-2 type transport system permease protein
LIVAFLVQGYNSMNLAEDIRLGRISAFLVYPFSFWSFQTASFLAFQGLQVLVALGTLLVMLGSGFLGEGSLADLGLGLGFCLYISFFWYQVSYLIGLMALWMEETWVLRVMFALVAQFLSGAFIPLEIYPQVLVDVLQWTPFPYLTFAPAKVFMGQYAGSLWQAMLVVLVWMGILAALTQWVWRRGMRLYTAAGM